MANYQTKDIRNIALMGHGSEGKTTLTEALLFAAKAIDRQGRVEDGNTVTDFDPEEIKRGISISAATAPIEWKQKMINIVDVPGYFDFIGEAMGPLRVVETAGIVVSAVGGISVGAEKAWKLATKNHVAKMFIVNQMDREHADFHKVEAALREKFGNSVVPILLPIGDGADFKGVVNVLENKAYERTNKGEPKEIPVPADMADAIEAALEEITEAAAMSDDELTMKYLDEGSLSHEEILEGFKIGMFSGIISPVVPCSALTGVGVAKMLDVMADFLPSPKRAVYTGVNPKNGDEVSRKCNNDEPFSAFVFKTIADPFVGKLSLFKVMSGSVAGSSSLYNSSADKNEKITGLFVLRGKKQISTPQLNAGDLGALNKLQYTNTGDTLCDPANPIQYPAIEYPTPCISKAVFAAKQGEEDKVFSGLARLMEEDPSIRLEKNVETTETCLAGQGELHLEVIRSKLATKFGAQATLEDPRIPYRETIRKEANQETKYARQSGGKGQYGHVKIKVEPNPGKGYEFVNGVVGGAIPKEYIPAVDNGIQGAMKSGVLAGYPVVDVKVTLWDGSYHEVDSSEMAFSIAGSMAFKEAMKKCDPVIMEPIMKVNVIVPDEYMGNVIGDLNSRRGQINNQESEGGTARVTALVPLSEMFGYATDLRSKTQGRGQYSMEPDEYQQVPKSVADKIMSDRAKA